MSWLNYADDAGRQLPKSFRDALDRIASGRYDLKRVDRAEYGLGEQTKNVIDKAYSRWYREATAGENYLKEMQRQQSIDVRDKARASGLDKMIDETLNEGASDIIGLDNSTRSAVLRGQAKELLDTDLGAGRMAILEDLQRHSLSIDDLNDQDLQKVISYLEQRKRMRGM
jgi:hypothetical protein